LSGYGASALLPYEVVDLMEMPAGSRHWAFVALWVKAEVASERFLTAGRCSRRHQSSQDHGASRDGKILAFANPQAKQLIGTDQRMLKDATGKAYGQEIYDAAQKPEGQVTEVSYLFVQPGDPKPVPKVSYVTRVGDISCGVGYYK
jgi:hypothetical protein